MSDSRIILLDVPFAEKDIAKQYGARWNPALKKWYVPEGLDPTPFDAWRADQNDLFTAEATTSLPQKDTGDNPGITLAAYLQQINIALNRGVPRSQWVRVEISHLKRTAGGHLQMELVEHDVSGQLSARLSAFLWQQKATRILDRFEQETGAQLENNIKVLLQLSVDHSPTYGLRAMVEDIDPSYTLGDIAKKLEAIRKNLIDLQVFDLNKRLPQPSEFTRVAVISPKEAAGLGDFREDADRLEAHGVCLFTYYTAIFQGPEAGTSLQAAITAFKQDVDRGMSFDALCIIRGGGSVTDLYWLNDRELAEAVCRLQIPVFTGIGHERDNTILDEIANIRFDTPSKVIGHIAGTLYANAGSAIQDLLMILRLSDGLLTSAEADIEQRRAEILAEMRHALTTSEHALESTFSSIRENSQDGLQQSLLIIERLMDTVKSAAESQIISQETDIETLRQRSLEFADLRLSEASHEIEALAREILGVGPDATLKRGFAMVRNPKGKPLTSRREAIKEQRLALEFHDGVLGVIPDRPK